MIRFPLLLFFSTFNLCIFAQDISFIKETINFNISNDTFNVYGKYTFQNKAGKIARQLVYYPINTSLDQLPYYKVSAIDSESKKELFINKFENYIVVPIEIKPYSKKNIIISYSQKIIDSSAVYILTTTKSWNLPLKKVKYIIETINDYPKVFISLTPNKIKRTKYKSIYVIKKRNFMPSEDLYICVH